MFQNYLSFLYTRPKHIGTTLIRMTDTYLEVSAFDHFAVVSRNVERHNTHVRGVQSEPRVAELIWAFLYNCNTPAPVKLLTQD